jgi:2,4-dienoyl-CoA reductase-like NADH-dependent reductase (Old Yellow Enzyme family)/thioredoxin reductase
LRGLYRRRITMNEFIKLFKPIKIGAMELKNRIIFAPLVTNMVNEEGYISDRQIDYYAERAQGGASLIVIECSYPGSTGYRRRIMLGSDRVISGLKKLVQAVHREGSKTACEINIHGGSADARDPASPSNVPNPLTGVTPRQLTVDDLKRLKLEFEEGVKRIRDFGFDGLMIHGATGYLIAEFLSPLVNKRTDEYGGDLKGRAKFPLDLVEVTRRSVGTDYPVIFRLMADERVPGGFEIKEGISLCKMLEERGVDAVDITSGSLRSHGWTSPNMYFPPACNVDLSEAIKREVKIPVGVGGKINDPYLAEEILRSSKADFICMGRGLLADPYLPHKVKEGNIHDICRCITCGRCGELIWTKNPIGCSINPAVGCEQEFALKLKPTLKKKRVLVLGGGPAGIEASLIADRKGHNVTLWEKSNKIGGKLNIAYVSPGKSDIKILSDYLKSQIKESSVKVILEKEATLDDIIGFAPDSVVLALGSSPLIPDIRGIERGMKEGKILDYREVLTGEKMIGNKIIIIGGGYIGCETALFLAEKGKEVTLAFRSPEPALDIVDPDNRLPLLKKLKESQIKIEMGVKEYSEILPGGIKFTDQNGHEVFCKVDNIVISAGDRPDKTLAQSLKGVVSELYEVGDYVEVRRILEAIHDGAKAALNI